MLDHGHAPDFGADGMGPVRTAAFIADDHSVTDAVALEVSMPGVGRGRPCDRKDRGDQNNRAFKQRSTMR